MTADLADEHQPLLGTAGDLERRQDEAEALGDVDFDPNGDSDNPLEWPAAFKWSIVGLLAMLAFTVTFTCISLVPVANKIVFELEHGRESKSASVLIVTIWELGEAAGPLLIAPLSEVFGRYPVINAANCLFIAATILAALSQSTWLFIAARALTGLAVASNVLAPAIVGDMFPSEQRGTAMSYIMLAPLIGGSAGPAIAGAIAQTMGWRKILWMSVILAGICEVIFLTYFRETYKVPILRRRAAKRAEAAGDEALKAVLNNGDHRSITKLWVSIKRPASVMMDSGVLMALSVFGGVAFSYFYFFAVTLSDILEGLYDLSPAETGTAFISFTIGSVFAAVGCNLTLDRIYIKLRDSNKGVALPEYRLPLVIMGGLLLPVVISTYGWTAELHLPLWIFLVNVGLMGFALELVMVPLMAYVVDAFGLYSASAMTAVIVTRCLMSTFLPLSSGPVIDSFGYGWGLTSFGLGSLCLAPIPVLMLRYGRHLRQRSSYTRDA